MIEDTTGGRVDDNGEMERGDGGAVSMYRARKRDKAEERRGKKEAGRTAVR